MGKKAPKQKKITEDVKQEKKWEHGAFVELDINDLEENELNPNEMSPDEFDMLSENIEEAGFLDPLLVVPLPLEKGKKQRFRIIDGAHRWRRQRLAGETKVPCVLADPARLSEKDQLKQLVRMNKIRGSFNLKKFARLADEMMTRYEVPFEELAHELGYADEDEFQHLIDAARDSLPNAEAMKEFDKAKKELRTVDDLSLLLNRLFTSFGDSLPAHFMILDFGGKEHIWVRMKQPVYKIVKSRAKECLEYGVTFDSIILRLLLLLDVADFARQHCDFLERAADTHEKIPVVEVK